jgi:superfamily II DNA or RNA helicase
VAVSQNPIPDVRGCDRAFVEHVLSTVKKMPGSDKHQLSRSIDWDGKTPDKSRLNGVLYALKASGHVSSSQDSLPRWSLVRIDGDDSAPSDYEKAELPALASELPALRIWQAEALKLWRHAKCRGVVQAVTGTGKTRVGIEAIDSELTGGGKVLVLVPSLALLYQWSRDLKDCFGEATIGHVGDGHDDSFDTHAVLIATPQSARNLAFRRDAGLLIADECHRYGSSTWSEALSVHFLRRLGLTATYERQDEGDTRLAEYFGETPVFDIDFRRALKEKVVSPFRLAFIGVNLTSAETASYTEFDEQCSRARTKLTQEYGLRSMPYGQFMLEVARTANGAIGTRAARVARRYLNNFSKRRALLADTPAKLERISALDPIIKSASGTLIFTQTKNAAHKATERLVRNGHQAAAIWGDLESDERESLLQLFREGCRTVLAAPRVLDEGINVPDADLGIVLSASSGRRQMIQRMGRVLRLKSDGRRARLAILFAVGTSEDPANGAHEGFIELATGAAEKIMTFASDASAEDICAFLNSPK